MNCEAADGPLTDLKDLKDLKDLNDLKDLTDAGQVSAGIDSMFNVLQSMFVSTSDNTVADLMEETAYDIHKMKGYMSEAAGSLKAIAECLQTIAESSKNRHHHNNNYQNQNNKP